MSIAVVNFDHSGSADSADLAQSSQTGLQGRLQSIQFLRHYDNYYSLCHGLVRDHLMALQPCWSDNGRLNQALIGPSQLIDAHLTALERIAAELETLI